MSADEWDLIQDRFGPLLTYIAQRITGDCANCEVEDNLQDLYIAADSALKGYRRKNNTDAPLSEFIDTRLFHSYIKTCLWNSKNSKGLKATRHNNTFVQMETYDE